MPDFTIIEAKPWHCGQMARALRAEHREVIARIGIDCHKELRARFNASSFRRAWLIDGQLAALGGVVGSKLSSCGMVWLALSHVAGRFPLETVREARRQLAELMQTKRDLWTTILDDDAASKRFAIFLGFVPGEEILAAPAQSRFGRRDIADKVKNNVLARVRVGTGEGIVMAYQREAA